MHVTKTFWLVFLTAIFYYQAFGFEISPYQYPIYLSSNKQYEAMFHDDEKIVVYLTDDKKCHELYRIKTRKGYIPRDIFISDCGKLLICGPNYYLNSEYDEAIIVYKEGKKKNEYYLHDIFDVSDILNEKAPYLKKQLLSSLYFMLDSTGYSADFNQFAITTSQGKKFIYDVQKDTLFIVNNFNFMPITLKIDTKMRPPQRVMKRFFCLKSKS